MKKILEEYGLIIVMIIVLCALIALAIFFSVHLKGRVGNTYNQFSNYAGNIVNNVTGGKLTNPIALVKGNQLTYNGNQQELIKANKPASGTLMFKLGESGSYSPSIPKAKDVGSYTVFYKIDGLGTDTPKEYAVTATIGKGNNSLTVTPSAKTLTYNGSDQQLINGGSCANGQIQYSLNNSTWSTSIPTGKNAGNYTVYYKVLETENYKGIAAKTVYASISKADSTCTPPTAKELVYNGSAQALVNAGSATGGTLNYKVNSGSWSTSVPSATNVGNYTVYYKVVGDENHNDIGEKPVSVTIKPNTLTVTLNNNGGTGGTTSVTATYGSAMPSATAPTKTGNTFEGYYDAQSGGTQYYTKTMGSAKNWDKYTNTTLYAHWTPIKYTVTLNVNGGTGGTTSVTATYGSAMPSATAPTKVGSNFGGYYDAQSGGTQYYTATMGSAKNWDKASNTTLYARWTVKTTTVTLNGNGGSGGTSSVTATYGSAMPSATAPSKTGYTFGGFYDATSGGTQYYTNSMGSAKAWNKEGTTATLYARWTAQTSTVTLNTNGGSGGTSSVTATYDSAMPALSSVPTKTGYSFDGYWDNASGGTKYYNADKSSAKNWDKTGNQTLYAHWKANTYTVSFSANNGSGGQTANVTATYGSAMPSITSTKPTRTGYTFGGYYDTNAATGGKQYYKADMSSATTWDKTSATTLYARWTAITYTVTLNGNGGSGGTGSVTATYGAAMPSATAPSRTGYNFGGFYDTSAQSGGTQYYTSAMASAKNYELTSGTTLYARWSAQSSTITLNANGGTGGQSTVTGTYNSNLPTVTLPTRIGYTFAGYYDTSATSGGNQYINASGTGCKAWDKIGNQTLYARWTAKTTTVTLNANGGSGGTSQVTATYGSAMPTATAPSQTGRQFYGYYDATSGGTQYYTNTMGSAKNWDKDASTATLYAVWGDMTSTVTLNANGGSGGTTSVTATYNQVMPTIASLPTRTGYTFDGYWDDASGGTKYYNADKSSAKNWDKVGSQTLYAHWKGNTYTVSFSANNGSGGQTANVTATYGSAMPSITSTKPTRTGYTFGGYYDTSAATGGTQYYTASMTSARSWDKTAATTLYARWIGNTYTVTLNNNNGTGGTTSVTATYGSAMPSATAPSRTGYTFAGYYNTSATSGGTQYYTSSMGSARAYDLTSATTLYARWTATTYTVTLNTNGGSGGTSSLTATYGNNLSSITKPTRAGYTFAGYYDTSATSGGNQYINASGTGCKTWNKTSNTTLYARWTWNNKTITFNINGGSGSVPSTITFTSDTYTSNIGSTVPTQTNYTFRGWATTSSYSNTRFAYGSSYGGGTDGNGYAATTTSSWNWSTWCSKLGKDAGSTTSITLYAQWEQSGFTVTFNANGHGTAPAAQQVTSGGKATVPTEPTASGYIFIDWYTNSSCTSLYDFNTPVTANKTLYAKWVTITTASLKFSSNSSFTLKMPDVSSIDCTVSTDNGVTWVATGYSKTFSGTSSQPIYVRGIMRSSGACVGKIAFTGNSCTGNIETLINYKEVAKGNHPTLPTTSSTGYFEQMFSGCTTLTTAPTLSLTSLGDNRRIYGSMFRGCTSLKTAPALPATTLSPVCYEYMFAGSGITATPKLPATTLTTQCYSYMFADCMSIQTINTISATTMAQESCSCMFARCKNLTSVPTNMLPATNMATECYESMFHFCEALTTVPKLPATTLAMGCYSGMFYGCKALTTAPALPATKLAKNCYNLMFGQCTSLTVPPDLPATTLVELCYQRMYESSGIKASETQTAYYNIPYRIPKTGTGTTATNATKMMFNSTNGPFTGAPSVNQTIYLYSSTPVSNVDSNTLNFSSPSSWTFRITHGKTWNGTLEYSKDEGFNWTTITGNTTVSVPADTKLYIRGTNNTYITGGDNKGWTLTGSNISCNGNIEYLLNYSTAKSGSHPSMGNGCYWGLFANNSSLISAPTLPATSLVERCYSNMFQGCSKLQAAPTIPATTVAKNCCSYMYSGCSSLTSATVPAATTLAETCYDHMFQDCTGLTAMPDLKGKTLANYCYYCMFERCKFTSTKSLTVATTLAEHCYDGMFTDMTNLTTVNTIFSSSSIQLKNQCCMYMFNKCSSLTTVPSLPSTKLAYQCYYGMFQSCTSLKAIPKLPATTMYEACYGHMFDGCTSLKVSESKSGDCIYTYRVPTSGTASDAAMDTMGMFDNTGGSFRSTPDKHKNYYINASPK